jgi:hypothetical protein
LAPFLSPLHFPSLRWAVFLCLVFLSWHTTQAQWKPTNQGLKSLQLWAKINLFSS